MFPTVLSANCTVLAIRRTAACSQRPGALTHHFCYQRGVIVS